MKANLNEGKLVNISLSSVCPHDFTNVMEMKKVVDGPKIARASKEQMSTRPIRGLLLPNSLNQPYNFLAFYFWPYFYVF